MANYLPIEKILDSIRNPRHPIIFNNGTIILWEEWLHHVNLWRNYLSTRKENVWALYHSNAYHFSTILVALWSLEKTVCLPCNQQPGLIKTIANDVDVFIGEFEHIDAITEIPTQVFPSQNIPLSLNTDKCLLQIYTSGSSGKPEKIYKTIQQLSNEIHTLHTLWGQRTTQHQILSSVSHQHIYGLLFSVLWPLAEGWILNGHCIAHFEEMPAHILPKIKALLISSPTHLSRIPDNIHHESAKQISAVFCSGAPLAYKHSSQAEHIFNSKVTEVYGSTETGGIAWKEQTSNTENLWHAMPKVQLRKNKDSCLEVYSPHLQDTTAWFTSSDRIILTTQTSFTLLGRSDRIVKVEGKRISLDEIESLLLRLDSIAEVKLTLLENRRTEIGAVIVLSQQAKQDITINGKSAFNQTLKDYLIQYIERPLLPRRWRYVENLPVNTQGKLSQHMLTALFMNPSMQKSHQRPTLPLERQCHKIDTAEYKIILFTQEDLLYFDGHFDKTPILPGVVQVHWAEHYAQQLFSITGDFLRLEAIKFQKIIAPSTELIFEIKYYPEKNKVHFSYLSSTGQHSSGRIVYSEQ